MIALLEDEEDTITEKMGSLLLTMWKFQNFSVTQILREIKVSEYRAPKNGKKGQY